MIKKPPVNTFIHLVLRQPNGEHSVYECMYIGQGVFKFLSNNSQHKCELRKIGKLHKMFILNKEILGWYIPKVSKSEKS